ncbi:hypothetical protein SAMN06265337_4295 [Hymenobacter gelipurpurascens]|uniref:Uncharacterized protein n=1 Tax=Hymenobacter gelipurpurascens TaxID=89968 RepID=A0A212UI15_9BACT|nr:hypothetical protein SAMN06265337_4295 [Hymenobacter gelipurpurascens]
MTDELSDSPDKKLKLSATESCDRVASSSKHILSASLSV